VKPWLPGSSTLGLVNGFTKQGLILLLAGLAVSTTACVGAVPGTLTAPEPNPTFSSMPNPELTPDGGLPVSLLGTQWYRLPTSQKVVALTFDAGANGDSIPFILETLEEYGVPGTFFLTGKWVEAYPEYAARIGARYPVANHSYSHPDLTELSAPRVRTEIIEAEAAIRAAAGKGTRRMFRFPFGASDQETIDLVNSLGYGAINWTVDTRGWQGTSGGQDVEQIVARVLEALQPGEIVIMHVGSHPTDGSTLDADALPRIIEEIQARGYGFVTIDQYLSAGG
jgi:peptidoglycan/xylan/chitin deacetylase (PgdA/CDA1 family)